MDHRYSLRDTAFALPLLRYAFVSLIVYLVLGAIRRVYFHPLSKYRGPKHFAIANLVHIHYVLRGRWVHKVLELHEKYGPVVRVAPDEISYISEVVWNDIYKTPHGQEQLKKNMPVEPWTWQHGLFDNPRDDEHTLIRKSVGNVLNDRGIREREFILLKHVSFLIKQLQQTFKAPTTSSVDIVSWYQMATTDALGELLSSEDFGALRNCEPHPVLKHDYEELKGLAIGSAFNRNFFTRNIFVKLLRPPQTTPHNLLAKDRFDRRLSGKGTNDKSDILSFVTRDMDTANGLTSPRALRVTADFIVAGTDTVAISLSGATYLLLRNRMKYVTWRDEVRSTFAKPEDITLAGVNALKYQNAVIMEALRLWPPGPETTRRVVKTPEGGKIINGEYVPEGTLVGVYLWAAGRYSRAWKNVGNFVPERWLTHTSENSVDNTNEYAGDTRRVLQPYSWGPRNCVGQSLANAELRLILASMIWHFDMELEDPNDDEWMNVKIFGLVAEKKPLRVKLTERSW